MDTIFADTNGASDLARDAAFSATDDYVGPHRDASRRAKTSSVVAGDFGTGAAIPGATVQYCIAVTNSGGAAATGVTISDTLPSQVTYDSRVWRQAGRRELLDPGRERGQLRQRRGQRHDRHARHRHDADADLPGEDQLTFGGASRSSGRIPCR